MAQKGKATEKNPTKGSISMVDQKFQSKQEGTNENIKDTYTTLPCDEGTGVAVAWTSELSCPKEASVVEQVMAVNRSLVQQIDALRLRLQVDSRQHNAACSALVQENVQKLNEKEDELKYLKSKLRQREQTVKNLTEENHTKKSEIDSLQHTINALRQDVEASKTYIDEIQHSLAALQEEKMKLETGAAYHEKEKLIQHLTKQVKDLRENISQLERELTKAKEMIAKQGGKLRLLENEKLNIHTKFREELGKATQNMRLEVEKMREVMRSQWEEMRDLRQQNEGMSIDIKEIKDMLLGDICDNHQDPVYTMGALKPSLPILTRNTKRVVPGKKKPLG